MYAHSNEVEEIGIISLTGVNIESNLEMEALLGVCSPVYCLDLALTLRLTDKVHIHSLHIV